MAVLTIPQAYAKATAQGFRGSSAITIVAIAKAESGLDTLITHSQGNSAGVDRGILQINSYYHSEVSDAQAFDPDSAFAAGYRISKQGTDFTQWATYTTPNPLNSYKRFIKQVEDQVQTSGLPVQPSPANLKTLFGWMGGIITPSQNYNPPGEWGNDIGVACDSHVFSPYAGTVAALTRTQDGKWGCVVAIHLNEDVGPYTKPSFYIQHLDAMNPQLVVGGAVHVGTFIGWSGGENNTGQIPSGNDAPYHSINGSQFSSGPHLELGFNGPNGAAWAATGPSFNPHEFLVTRYNALMSGSILVSGDTTPGQTVTLSQKAVNLLSFIPTLAGTTGTSMSFADLCARMDFAEEWVFYNPGGFLSNLNPLSGIESTIGQITDNLPPIAVRGTILGLGVGLMVAGGIVLFRKPATQAVQTVAPAALDLAALL